MAIRFPFTNPRSASTPSTQPKTCDASPRRSNGGCAKSSCDPVCPHPTQSPQSAATPGSPPTATQSRVHCRCPQSNPAAATGSRSPGSARPAILSRIKLRTPSLHKYIELLRLQQFIEPLIEGMSWRRRQLRISNPNVFLLFPLLARPHRHTRILRILPVDPSNSFAYASGLTPRADREPQRRCAAALSLKQCVVRTPSMPRSCHYQPRRLDSLAPVSLHFCRHKKVLGE